jgi:hypothetical protein
MSYCKFANTLINFKRCMTAVEEAQRPCDIDLSPSEDEALHGLARRCEEFLREYKRLFPE